MNLIIRSQDKLILTTYRNLVIDKKDDNFIIINTFETSDGFIVGTFKTKERALEILDEIAILMSWNKTQNIYEMPKE